MTLDEFTTLDEIRQAETLIHEGVFLAERPYKNFIIFLYQVENFYVEVYHNIRYNILQGMKSFIDDETLAPFLDTIDISCLFDNSTPLR